MRACFLSGDLIHRRCPISTCRKSGRVTQFTETQLFCDQIPRLTLFLGVLMAGKESVVCTFERRKPQIPFREL